MSRFDSDDYDPQFPNEGELWEANLERHMRGAQGQRALRDLRDALLALPEKKLIHGRLADEQGYVCAVGAVALHRRSQKGDDPAAVLAEMAALLKPDERWGEIDAWEAEERTMNLGMSVGLKRCMAVTMSARNDGGWYAPSDETPEQRFERVLAWVESNIKPEAVAA